VEHLTSLGHERIAFVGFDTRTDTARRREQGYREAMLAAGVTIDPRWAVSEAPSRQGGRVAITSILDAVGDGRPPTAVFCASLLSAFGALSTLRQRHVRVPEQMSVVAFNDHESAEDTTPPLTTVRLPNREMGREAMRMAIRAADGLPLSDAMLEGPIELIVRGSTAAAEAGSR
jgi:DNA-binding LacI/PurR family transcriptional regulator